MKTYKRSGTVFLCLAFMLCFALSGCGDNGADVGQAPQTDVEESIIKVIGTDGSEQDVNLNELYSDKNNYFEHIYSTINNWPSKGCNAAKGIKIEAIPGLSPEDDFTSVTFESGDGYRVTLTKEQLYCDRFHYPNLENDEETGKEPVETIIAMEYKEGSGDLSEAEADKPFLMLGQSNIQEHNTIAGVVDIATITISNEKAEQWAQPTAYPEPGVIYAGDKVKLEHSGAGAFAKMYYTTDGSDPTVNSTLYNPSTYQPELNAPIEITKDTVIKVLVSGYGKEDSEIATFEFKVK